MKRLIDRRALLRATAALGVLGAGTFRPNDALAAETEIQMLSVHPDDRRTRMVFFPLIATVEAGDTVRFVATDKSHNTQSIDGMIPDGGPTWKGRINEEVSVTLDVPGLYGYKCQPHLALGMVGLIIVRGDGMASNYEAAKAVQHRARAKRVWEEIWARVEADNLLG